MAITIRCYSFQSPEHQQQKDEFSRSKISSKLFPLLHISAQEAYIFSGSPEVTWPNGVVGWFRSNALMVYLATIPRLGERILKVQYATMRVHSTTFSRDFTARFLSF